MNTLSDSKRIFDSLFESSRAWLSGICPAGSKQERTWPLDNGAIAALCCADSAIPKAGLSLLKQQDAAGCTFRVGLHIYAAHPHVPDGSFAVLFVQQKELNFIGGVLELFPAVRIDEAVDGFRNSMREVARAHDQDYDMCSRGLAGAFTLHGTDVSLGAEAGFNFYRSGLAATMENTLFAQDAFLQALAAYKNILEKYALPAGTADAAEKARAWKLHRVYLQNEDVGIQYALEQNIPLENFVFSAFQPEQALPQQG